DGIRDPLVTGVQTCALPIFARAGAGGQTDLREHRDVVTLVGFRRALRALAVRAAAPQARDRAARRVREDARLVDDFGVLGRLQRHLDDVDAEERRVRVVLGLPPRAARELLTRSHGARAGAVDVEIVCVP